MAPTGSATTGLSRVLLVEDNPDHAELVRRSLSEHRANTILTVLPDGEAALDFLLRRKAWEHDGGGGRPQLILLDLRLPKLDGLQVLRELKTSKELRDIPIVVLTTSEAEADILRAYEFHVNSYLVKPVDFDRFVNLMGDVERYWFDRNRQPQERWPSSAPA
jgi:CheY-like chemotaxis protein